MRKYKGFLISVSMAAVLMASATVCAEETETTETVAEVMSEEAVLASEAEEAAEGGITSSDRASLESYAQQSIEMIVSMTDEQANEILNPSSILSKYQDSMVSSVQSWVDVKESLGAYKQILAHDITVDDDIVIETACEFENGESVITTTLSLDDLTLESMAFSAGEQTMGEKMKEAVLNTLMGIGVVFAMLFFLTLLIAQFRHVSEIEAKLKKKQAPEEKQPVAAAVPVQEEEELMDDGELIAVIAAAIAAAEGTSTDGFVVRSIKKSNRNKWQRA